MVRQAKALGINVTCDVSANHVHLSEMDIGYFDSNYHLVPPLRSLRDREALRRGVEDGTIDAICSDHTPVDDDAKQLPFGESEAGRHRTGIAAGADPEDGRRSRALRCRRRWRR